MFDGIFHKTDEKQRRNTGFHCFRRRLDLYFKVLLHAQVLNVQISLDVRQFV